MRTTRGSGGRASDGQEQERFARAVDSDMREVSDHSFHRELAAVAVLRQVGAQVEATIGPDPAERERMRQRVMAEFPSVVHDGTSPVLPLSSPRRASRNRHWIPDETRGRLVVAAAAALCLLMSLSGMSVLLSRDALPGDALYTFKRSAESAELGLTFGDQPKALKHLEFASARVSEIEMMAEHTDAAGNWSAGQEKFVRVLDDFDADTTAGARLLTALAAHGQFNMLSGLRSWAEQQETRLQAVHTALPLPATARLDSTLGLLDRVVARTSALDHRSDCTTVTSGTRDDLGLLPARDACTRIPVDGTSSAVPLPDPSGAPAASPPDAMSPGLLGSPSGSADSTPAEPGQRGRPGLPGAPDTRGVLPTPGQPGAKPSRPLPGSDSPSPVIPLPLPGIPMPVLPPPS
ncbi:MAG: DUF5667 domain-containing protein [Pseudonocardiaceae bacterium]